MHEPDYDPLPLDDLDGLAATLRVVIDHFEGQPFYRRMRLRIRELGENAKDEQAQFRVLKRACRDEPALAERLMKRGFPNPLDVNSRVPEGLEGALIQAFNHVIERDWEDA